MMMLVGPNGRAQVAWNEAIQERVNVTASALAAIKYIKMCGLSPVLENLIQVNSPRFQHLEHKADLDGNSPIVLPS
jgi:hypothetical protein